MVDGPSGIDDVIAACTGVGAAICSGSVTGDELEETEIEDGSEDDESGGVEDDPDGGHTAGSPEDTFDGIFTDIESSALAEFGEP
jgi:hypothetical protein